MSALPASEDAPELATATPAMKQYLQIKMRYADCILFYRMGDFYELFFDDAVLASQILDIALTKRGKHAGEDIPMCGVPVHSHEAYLEKLIASGHKIAICEQLETPEEAKKRGGYKAVVERDVVRVVTPGTITEEGLLAGKQSHYLACVTRAHGTMALAWLELSTGYFRVMATDAAQLAADVARVGPKEVLIAQSLHEEVRAAISEYPLSIQPDSQFDPKKTERLLLSQYGVQTLEPFGALTPAEVAACGALVEYLKLTQLNALPRLDPPQKEQAGLAMQIDAATRRNLELVATLSGSRKGSLLSVIDKTQTAAGGRLLANWLTAPLTDLSAITARHDMIAWCLSQSRLHQHIRQHLPRAADMERAISRVCLGRCGPRDLLAIRTTLEMAQAISEQLHLHSQQKDFAGGMPTLLKELIAGLGEHSALTKELHQALIADPPLLARDGGFIAEGHNAGLDHHRRLQRNAKQVIAQMQQRYAKDTGIGTLKIKFNNVLGYFIEITAAHESKITEQFIHRQSLANNLRYTTTELSETAREIAEASGRAQQIELECFEALCGRVKEASLSLIACARALASFDVLAALATLAEEQQYCRPEMHEDCRFDVRDVRHPVVEAALRRDGERFMANHCDLSEAQSLWLLTGPNMAGKSTFLRQNALIAILAQMGSYVPASSAEIGVVDRLFSRVGAADDLARGQSTFMVEMVETAMIMNQATERSLVILDEIGRGTATYDGLSIAWAVVEHLHNRTQCRALFATHYHELTQLSDRLPRLACYTMAVKEWKGQVVFLHEVKAGTADRSYGIHVASIAGLPQPVIARAKEVLHELEGRAKAEPLPLFAHAMSEPAAPRFETHPAMALLEEIEPDELSPKEALELLYRLKQ